MEREKKILIIKQNGKLVPSSLWPIEIAQEKQQQQNSTFSSVKWYYMWEQQTATATVEYNIGFCVVWHSSSLLPHPPIFSIFFLLFKTKYTTGKKSD